MYYVLSLTLPIGAGSTLWTHVEVLGNRPVVRTTGKDLPTTHCSLSFLTSMRIVYCRIKKLSTDNETLTQGH